MNKTSRFKQSGSQERRGYHRVLDAVALDIRRLEPGEVADLGQSGEETIVDTSGWQPFAGIDALRSSFPSAATHIEKLESLLRKAQDVSHPSSLASDAPTHKVSLSGSGIAFAHDLVLQPGDRLVLGLTLFPSREFVQVPAMVISVGGAAGPVSGGKYAARAMFSDIDASAREKIVQHIDFVQGEM